jgi:ribose/xylose/arabinose/galactoside ABC-type transport system permease subunit
MLQGAVAIIFGVAIAKSAILSRWIGAVGIAVGAVGIAAGVVTAYIGFSELVATLSILTLYPWIVILGIFMWRKTKVKIVTR